MLQKRVLVVDDDDYWRNEVSGVVRGLGYEPEAAADAREAEELLKKRHFDVIVTDNYMGTYDAGLDLLVRIRAAGVNIPAILHTSQLAQVQRKRLEQEVPGAIGLNKSTGRTHPELIAAIERLLAE